MKNQNRCLFGIKINFTYSIHSQNILLNDLTLSWFLWIYNNELAFCWKLKPIQHIFNKINGFFKHTNYCFNLLSLLIISCNSSYLEWYTLKNVVLLHKVVVKSSWWHHLAVSKSADNACCKTWYCTTPRKSGLCHTGELSSFSIIDDQNQSMMIITPMNVFIKYLQ